MTSLAGVDLAWIAAGVACFMFYYVFGVLAYVLSIIADPDNPVGIRDLMSVEASGVFFMRLTPNSAGAPPAQIYRLTRAGLSVGEASALNFTRTVLYEAQVKSTVMLKNHGGILPLKGRKKAYIPTRHLPEYRGFWGTMVAARDIVPVSRALASRYFDVVDTAEEADVAIVFIESPNGGSGYSLDDLAEGGNGLNFSVCSDCGCMLDGEAAFSEAGGITCVHCAPYDAIRVDAASRAYIAGEYNDAPEAIKIRAGRLLADFLYRTQGVRPDGSYFKEKE